MCMICRQTPCDSRCPNAPDPPTVFTCALCGAPIVQGDEYLELDGSYYHMEDCARAEPQFTDQGGSHFVACHRSGSL